MGESAQLLSAPSDVPTLQLWMCFVARTEIAQWGKNKTQSKEFLQLAAGVGAAVVLGEQSSPLD